MICRHRDFSKSIGPAGGGVALSRGSATSHTAMLARARGVPMLVQLGALPQASQALLDAEQGFVELDPSDGAAARLRVAPRGAGRRSAGAERVDRAIAGDLSRRGGSAADQYRRARKPVASGGRSSPTASG